MGEFNAHLPYKLTSIGSSFIILRLPVYLYLEYNLDITS